MKTKSLTRALELQQQNFKQYIRIIDDFVSRIKRQNCGCNVPNYGASYYNNFDKTFDPFGLCLGFAAINKHFGVISSEEQKPLVSKMSRKYNVNCETDKEYSAFVLFLQELQDIHDFSFDEYYVVEGDRMKNYLHNMNKTRSKIKEMINV